MAEPKRILEIGTFTGYSAICLSEGLAENGELHTIEVNDELEELILENFKSVPNNKKMILHIGSALELIKNFTEPFDLIFIDGEKREYPQYFEMCQVLLRKGGYLLADNVLWDGKVADATQYNDRATSALIEYNQKVKCHPEFECVILEIRDGISIARKK